MIIYNTLGMWYSTRADADRRGIRPSMDTSIYQHRDAGYGHSSQYSKAQGLQHSFITPGQHRHVHINRSYQHFIIWLSSCKFEILILFLQHLKILHLSHYMTPTSTFERHNLYKFLVYQSPSVYSKVLTKL